MYALIYRLERAVIWFDVQYQYAQRVDWFYSMNIAVCTVQLYLAGNGSLKGKRSRLKPLLVRLGREFNVSAAEVDQHDLWQSATVALAAVGTDNGYLHGLMEKCVRWIESCPFDVQLVDYRIEHF